MQRFVQYPWTINPHPVQNADLLFVGISRNLKNLLISWKRTDALRKKMFRVMHTSDKSMSCTVCGFITNVYFIKPLWFVNML